MIFRDSRSLTRKFIIETKKGEPWHGLVSAIDTIYKTLAFNSPTQSIITVR